MGAELLQGLSEFWEFDIDELELIVEDLTVLVFEFYGVNVGVLVLVVIEDEVENTDGIDGSQFVIPDPLECLLLDREASVENTAVFEKVLLGFLNFDDEAFSIFSLAIDIENGFAIDVGVAKVFSAFIGKVFDVMVGR